MMDASTLDWLVTLLVVHIAALAGAIYLFRGAPCWMQRLSVFLLIVSFVAFCGAYLAAIAHIEQWWALLAVGAALEHLAVLLYVFRIWWQGEERKWKLSTNSLS